MDNPFPLSFQLANTFIRACVSLGLSRVVISPGSRSTPLVLAINGYQALHKQVLLDERSAGFTALGMSRWQHQPAALVCTSGTAVANYLPAVIEAHQSAIPLLVLTADRSALDRANSAPQSMTQMGLFAPYVRFQFDAALPGDTEGLLRMEYLAWQAMDAAIQGRGPVHLNFPFDKPLEPNPEAYEAFMEAGHSAKTPALRRSISPHPLRDIEAEELTGLKLSEYRRPVILAGPSYFSVRETRTLRARIRGTGIPLVAELSANMADPEMREYLPQAVRMLRMAELRKQLEPDLILRVGHFPSLKGMESYVETYREVDEILFSPDAHLASPQHPNGTRCLGLPSVSLLTQLSQQLDPAWLPRWKEHCTALTSDQKPSQLLTDGSVHAQVLKHLPAQSAVFVSNSLPIRDLSLFGELLPDTDPLFFSARGVSGIDGITSQALGLSLARETEARPPVSPSNPSTLPTPSTIPTTVLLTGDLAFLHDLNALLSARMLKRSRLVVFVINNRGGQIFRMLPIGHFDHVYETYFGTPQSADIASLCKGFSVSYFQARSMATLAHTLKTVFLENGLTVVECLTDPAASVQERLA